MWTFRFRKIRQTTSFWALGMGKNTGHGVQIIKGYGQ